jgi:hypothetical protein
MGGPTLSSPIGEPFQHAQFSIDVHFQYFFKFLPSLGTCTLQDIPLLTEQRKQPGQRRQVHSTGSTNRVAHALMVWDLNSG